MKTTITKTASNEVTLHAIDPYTDDLICRVFYVPTSGGFVRERTRFGDPQVCYGLSRLGNTMTAKSGDDLLTEIRREWRAYRREAANDVCFY